MEHRLSTRIALQKSVTVESPRIGCRSMTARDISLYGMFVESTPPILPLNATVTVAFSAGNGGHSSEFAFKAMVVRHTKTGVALMFPDLDVDEVRTLHAALYEPVESR